MMRTANPMLNDQVFQIEGDYASTTMTLQGTVTKTAILLATLVIMATIVWASVWPLLEANSQVIDRPGMVSGLSNVPGMIYGFMFGGMIGGFILALITMSSPKSSPITAPMYAAAEGVFLGAFSAMFEFMFPQIIMQAVILTFGIFASLLIAYQSGLIRATENFKLGVAAATGGIMLVYLATIVLSFFGITMPFIHETGLMGIGFSLFVVVIAAMNLVLDFDFIENGVEHGAPKYMEWYAGFGLLVTLIWLYIEIVRLLAKLRSRD